MFNRGYKEVKEKVNKYPKIFMSCLNCVYYYQAVGDKEECCQNTEVLQYDMVVEDTRVYCIRWETNYFKKEKPKNPFKGRRT